MGLGLVGRLPVGPFLALTLLISVNASASVDTVYFQHEDERYLYPSQHQGGAALVSPGTRGRHLPLLVFLHGTNPARALHFWMGGGGRDLRPVAAAMFASRQVKPFIFAGPSQTRAAEHGRNLWTHFDLDRFVGDVGRALDGRATVDPESVIVVGHSGAGCNLSGGLAADFWSRGRVAPRSLVSIDPCLDADLGEAFARRPSAVPLWVMWQSRAWPRQPGAFERALTAGAAPGRVDRIERLNVAGPTPHETILPLALERAVRDLLAVPRQQGPAS